MYEQQQQHHHHHHSTDSRPGRLENENVEKMSPNTFLRCLGSDFKNSEKYANALHESWNDENKQENKY